MRIEVTEETPAALAEYARIPIAFEVREILDLEAPAGGLGGFILAGRTLDTPYRKDYDRDPGEAPLSWPDRFDVSRWGFLLARVDGVAVGAAAVAFDTPGLRMLEERRDAAVLWDIRVAPGWRGRGVGRRLFGAAESWAAARAIRRLIVETQNINAPACRFHVRQGCYLGTIRRFAYQNLPDEIQLLWYKDLP